MGAAPNPGGAAPARDPAPRVSRDTTWLTLKYIPTRVIPPAHTQTHKRVALTSIKGCTGGDRVTDVTPQHLPMGEQGRGLPWGLLAALLGSPPAGKSWTFSGAFCSLFFGWGRDGAGGETRILRPLPRMSPRATHRVASVPGGLVIGVLGFCLAVAVWRPRGEDSGSRGSRKPRAAPPSPPQG